MRSPMLMGISRGDLPGNPLEDPLCDPWRIPRWLHARKIPWVIPRGIPRGYPGGSPWEDPLGGIPLDVPPGDKYEKHCLSVEHRQP